MQGWRHLHPSPPTSTESACTPWTLMIHGTQPHIPAAPYFRRCSRWPKAWREITAQLWRICWWLTTWVSRFRGSCWDVPKAQEQFQTGKPIKFFFFWETLIHVRLFVKCIGLDEIGIYIFFLKGGWKCIFLICETREGIHVSVLCVMDDRMNERRG